MEVSRISYVMSLCNWYTNILHTTVSLYEDNEVTWCPVLNINKTRSIVAEDSYSILYHMDDVSQTV